MFQRHRPPRFDQRVDARRPISADLLAAASLVRLTLADGFRTAWFDAVEQLTECRRLLVFDEFVVGPPEPMLLEAAHQVRLTRRAEHLGHFDDEEERWYAEHRDSDDPYERPTTPERVLLQLADRPEGERVGLGVDAVRRVCRSIRPDPEHVVDHVCLELTLERLVAGLADSIRLGGAAFVDARLPGEGRGGLRWVA